MQDISNGNERFEFIVAVLYIFEHTIDKIEE